ncbi:hypothetical protein, partial [Mesorhizobium sp.]|uniref:hypothetical protein n=1 Tax=Mesorhizobium sp. TaxID=1871066 RepID=UPI0025DC7EEE
MHQHVRSLDTDTDDPRKKANHCERTLLRVRNRRELPQPLLFDLEDLFTQQVKPSEITAQLGS